MAKGKWLFTSESVAMGHPDKVADQISDGVLDAILSEDPTSRVACETLVTTGLAVVAGEITTKAKVNYPEVVRRVIREIGYTDGKMGIDADSCAVMITLDSQSPDIAMGVDEDSAKGKEIGAGDQGMMFGFACNETKELMPAPIEYAHRLVNKLADLRFERKVDWLRPDAKSQVTMEYVDEKPTRVHTVVISTQHDAKVSLEEIRSFVTENVIKPCIPAEMVDKNVIIHVNPTGRFVVGGPHGDCGLTGRKIIVDTYGGRGRHGGGAFSGKDPTKVDRSACYMARYVAKNIVAAELADQCEVQVAYAIGVAKPVSVYVNTFGTGRVADTKISQAVQEIFPLTPAGIINHLQLRRPIYQRTASGGHFGRPDFPWEKTDKVAELQSALAAAAV
jgi:S-adenosylmethionine synthetase